MWQENYDAYTLFSIMLEGSCVSADMGWRIDFMALSIVAKITGIRLDEYMLTKISACINVMREHSKRKPLETPGLILPKGMEKK